VEDKWAPNLGWAHSVQFSDFDVKILRGCKSLDDVENETFLRRDARVLSKRM
jgi:hypothetical protein